MRACVCVCVCVGGGGVGWKGEGGDVPGWALIAVVLRRVGVQRKRSELAAGTGCNTDIREQQMCAQ